MKNRTEDIDYSDLHWGKYENPISQFISLRLVGNGDFGDEENSNGDGDGIARYGRRIYWWNNRGFEGCTTFATVAEAEEKFAEAVRAELLAGLDCYTVYSLANLADCAGPDSDSSPGSQFLSGVVDDIRERVTDGTFDEDSASEIADSAVPIYTRDVWSTFVDLAAYNEDPSELVDTSRVDMEQSAKLCLYMIAERLVYTIAEELSL